MSKNLCFIICLFLLVTTFSSGVYSGVPAKINFQGRLEESGQAVNGLRSMVFTIYAAETGGAAVWTGQPSNVVVTNGLFSVNLETGTLSNISTDTFSQATYIEVSVDGVPLLPRQEIISAPYSLVAQTLADNGCSNNQILKWDSIGAHWDCADSEATSIGAGDYFNDVRVSSAIYADNAGSVSGLASGDYLNDIRVSSATYADTAVGLATGNYFNDIKVSSAIYADNVLNFSGNISPAQITSGGLPSTVYISSISVGDYFNDVRVSSAIYSDNAEAKVAKAGDIMNGALKIIGSSITVIAADTMPSSMWVSTSAITPHLYVSTSGNTGIGLSNPNSKLQIAGPMATSVIKVSATYIVKDNDSVVIVDTTSGNMEITLPSAVGIKGRRYAIKNVGTAANSLTINTNGSEEIDNYASGNLELIDWEGVILVSDGTNWVILASCG